MTELGGRIAQDIGLSRILGQILVHLYLQPEPQSLETIAANLGLSKAAISIAVRQLETLGLVHRVWVKGDRRNYYRTADNIGMALQKGLFSVLNQKIQILATELDAVSLILDQRPPLSAEDEDADFLRQRIRRTQELRNRMDRLLNNRLVKWMAGM
jgi:DNA-binding transcriptional regulator GbsR (MarR family)